MKRHAYLLCALIVLLAGSSAADGWHWHDRLYDKDWMLTPRSDEVLVVFARGTHENSRAGIASAEGLQERHAYSGLTGVAVYRVQAGDVAQDVAARLSHQPNVLHATPAVVDQDGFTKYYVPGRVVIQLQETLSDAECRAIVRSKGSRIFIDYWTPGFYQVSTPPGRDVFETLRDWYDDPHLLFAEPAWIEYESWDFTPNDPQFGTHQWNLHSTSTNNPEYYQLEPDIQAPLAWDITRGDPNVIVAIVDNGMDLTHGDLAGNLLDRGTEDWDFYCDPDSADPRFPDPVCDGDSSPDEESGSHGTSVAGVAAAVQNNATGISGVAPLCKIMPLRINDEPGYTASRADAINFARAKKVATGRPMVINCSWHTSGYVESIYNAISSAYQAGCIICATSGNDGTFPVKYPAAHPQVLAVGATGKNDSRCWFSQYGDALDVVAPGDWIQSTTVGGGYNHCHGTSFASPHAAGICALILSLKPSLSPLQVYQVVTSSAEDLVGPPGEDIPGRDNFMGYGRANAYRAVQLASGCPLIDVTRRDLRSGTSPGNGLAWGDYDGDGDLDLYMSNHPGANRLLKNEGAEKFTKVTNALLEDTGWGAGVGWADYDNDGDLDLYLVNNGSANKLFRNDGGGSFADATTGPLGDTGNGSGFAWLDYNRDGRIDIYLANSGSANKLFRNDGCGNWSDATHGPLGDAGNGWCVAAADYDNDGDTDIYLVNNGSQNKLFRNDNGTFVDATTAPLGVNATSKSAVWGDYDNDGDLDLFLVSGGGNKLFRNEGGPSWTFTDVTSGPLAGYSGWSAGWGDYDNDGDLDLYISNTGGNKLLSNVGGGAFADSTRGPLGDAGDGRGVAWADYDRDGDLDLYLANNGTSNKLFRNHAPSGAHWLHVKLQGTDSNRSGIGARVRVAAGGVTQIREVEGASGLRSQNSLPVEFGLGSSSSVSLLEITWPNGTVQTVSVGTQVDRMWNVDECPPAPEPIASSMAGWSESNPDPSFMTLHFSFRTTKKADQFKVRYRLAGSGDPWNELVCTSPGVSCIFGCSGTYERTTGYFPCEERRFEWQAMAHDCGGWTADWMPSTPKTFTAYCLQEP
jgi:hypothetical protein